MEEEVRSRSEMLRENAASRKWLIWPALIVAAFLAGLLPMWWVKQNVSAELGKTKRELVRQQLLSKISAAAIYARRGEYETARQNASNFFTDIQAELGDPESKILTEQERNQLPQLLSGRDEMITLLSRADPASGERLSDFYVELGAATGGAQP